MKNICLIVFIAVILSACSVIDAWGEQEAEKARSLSLDNAAKQSAINARATAAAGIANATATGVALQAQATQTSIAIVANSAPSKNGVSDSGMANSYRASLVFQNACSVSTKVNCDEEPAKHN